jgi:hypothetical protein
MSTDNDRILPTEGAEEYPFDRTNELDKNFELFIIDEYIHWENWDYMNEQLKFTRADLQGCPPAFKLYLQDKAVKERPTGLQISKHLLWLYHNWDSQLDAGPDPSQHNYEGRSRKILGNKLGSRLPLFPR